MSNFDIINHVNRISEVISNWVMALEEWESLRVLINITKSDAPNSTGLCSLDILIHFVPVQRSDNAREFDGR